MMAGNPIVARELRGALRARRTLILAVVATAAMAALVAWMWPDRGVFSLQAQASRALILAFATAQIGLVLLYAPAFASAAIVYEKENVSWDLLFATLLPPWKIVSGKWLASLGLLLGFVVLTFPFLATAFVLGALSVAEAVRLYGVVFATCVLAGLAGLAISARARRTHGALIGAYVAMLAWAGFPWIAYVLMRDFPGLGMAAYLLRAASPVAAVMSVLQDGPALISDTLPATWALYLGYAFVCSLLLLAGLLVAVYRLPSPRLHGKDRVIDDDAELSRRRRRFPFYLLDPQRRKKGLSRLVNPVFAREFRGRAFGGGVWIFRAMVGCFVVAALLVVLLAGQVGGQSPDGIKAFALAFQIGLVLLVAPALTAGAVTQEREARQLDLLRLSRLGAWTLLSGKTQVAFLLVVLLLVGSVPLWAVIGAMQLNTVAELLRAWAVIGTTIALGLAAGLMGSALARRTAVAAGIAYGLLLVIAGFTLAPHLVPARFSATARETLTAANPFLVAYQVLRSEAAPAGPALWLRHLRFAGAAALIMGSIAYARTWLLFRPAR